MAKRHWNKREKEVRAETLQNVEKIIDKLDSHFYYVYKNEENVLIKVISLMELKAKLEKLKEAGK